MIIDGKDVVQYLGSIKGVMLEVGGHASCHKSSAFFLMRLYGSCVKRE